jgi:hypothetical protein
MRELKMKVREARAFMAEAYKTEEFNKTIGILRRMNSLKKCTHKDA